MRPNIAIILFFSFLSTPVFSGSCAKTFKLIVTHPSGFEMAHMAQAGISKLLESVNFNRKYVLMTPGTEPPDWLSNKDLIRLKSEGGEIKRKISGEEFVLAGGYLGYDKRDSPICRGCAVYSIAELINQHAKKTKTKGPLVVHLISNTLYYYGHRLPQQYQRGPYTTVVEANDPVLSTLHINETNWRQLLIFEEAIHSDYYGIEVSRLDLEIEYNGVKVNDLEDYESQAWGSRTVEKIPVHIKIWSSVEQFTKANAI